MVTECSAIAREFWCCDCKVYLVGQDMGDMGVWLCCGRRASFVPYLILS